MDNNLNTYGYGGATSESYPESEDWEFPLSSSLAEMENIRSGQVWTARYHFNHREHKPAVGNEQGIKKQTVVIGESQPIEITPRPKKAGKGKGKATVKAHGTRKRVSQRGKSFNKEEDRIICSAFLNVSKDPITGTNQSSGGYYQRMHEYFVENMDIPTSRSQLVISNRWLAIQRAVNKLCGFFSTVERLDASGKTEKDRIDDAAKLFEEKEPWTFSHCWDILRHEPK